MHSIYLYEDQVELTMMILYLLYTCRLSEQSRLVAEQKRLVSELRGRYEDAQQWNFKYKVLLYILPLSLLLCYIHVLVDKCIIAVTY